MAHFVPTASPNLGSPQSLEQARAWSCVERVFRRRPSGFGRVASNVDSAEACSIRLSWGCCEVVEIICAGGFLIAIPPVIKK